MREDRSRAAFYQSLLGIVLLIMGRRQEALAHLQASREEAHACGNIPALHVSQKGLSYYYYFEGQIEKAYEIARATVHAEAIGFQYYWPAGIEILHAFAEKGLEAIPGLDFEQEMERLINGINLHLRGVALRIRACQSRVREETHEVVLSLLEASEADLLKTGDPIELAKTRCEAARLMLTKRDRASAVRYALQAWEGLSGYGQNFFPDDLMSLLKVGISPRPDIGKQELMDRYMDLMAEFVPSTEQEELLMKLTAVTSRFFGAERGGLFWFSGSGDNPRPMLRAGYNLARDDVNTEDFRSCLGLIFKTYRNRQVLVIRHSPPASPSPGSRQALSVICLPVEIQGTVRGVIYLDNSYLIEESSTVDRDVLVRVARHAGASMERIIRHAGIIEAQKAFAAAQQSSSSEIDAEYRILGKSPVMRSLLTRTDQAAFSEAAILILGETGSGKELLARRIHAQSSRKERPFVT
ncbi:hypothetical protein EG829_12295, partial [bacterium]|nr:hypothetical protein [bacterium]